MEKTISKSTLSNPQDELEKCIIREINTCNLSIGKHYNLRKKKKVPFDNTKGFCFEEHIESDSDYDNKEDEDEDGNSVDGVNGEEEEELEDVKMKSNSNSFSDQEIKEINNELVELNKENIEEEKDQYEIFKKNLSLPSDDQPLNSDSNMK